MIFGQAFETPFDCYPTTKNYKTYNLDVILARLLKEQYNIDGTLTKLSEEHYDIDVLLASISNVQYNSDSLMEKESQTAYYMNGRIKSDIHLGFYVMDGAVALCNVRAKYRMSGRLVSANTRSWPTPKRLAFSAKQSLIVPSDVNADDIFDLADRRVVAAKKKNALKRYKR